jgi:hypothetical protein
MTGKRALSLALAISSLATFFLGLISVTLKPVLLLHPIKHTQRFDDVVLSLLYLRWGTRTGKGEQRARVCSWERTANYLKHCFRMGTTVAAFCSRRSMCWIRRGLDGSRKDYRAAGIVGGKVMEIASSAINEMTILVSVATDCPSLMYGR